MVEKLRAGDLNMVDQESSPLGRRRHINAIRSGQLKGNQVGRRWLASKQDVDAYLDSLRAKRRERKGEAPDSNSASPTKEQLAAELGLRLVR